VGGRREVSQIDLSNQDLYWAREKRVNDAIALQRPDRVPVAPVVAHYYPTRVVGVSNKDAMLLHERRFEIWKELTLQLNWDMAPPPGPLMPARNWEILGITQFKWPGGELDDDAPFQFVGGETMQASEYDEFLGDPDGFTMKKIWPRIATSLAPLGRVPLPPLHWMSSAYTLSMILPAVAAAPPIMDLLERLLEMGREAARYSSAAGQYVTEMARLGYPISWGGVVFTAFDWVADFLRGMEGALTDMFREPDRLLATVEMLTPMTIQQGIVTAQQSASSRVFIPLHWGGAGFMSNEQYGRFYWPSLKILLLALIEAGLTPIPFFEGDYTPRLEFLTELPKGKVVGHFDIVDRRRAEEAIGNTMCFWGNVSSSLLAIGTPAQVKHNVKELIDIFGDNGGLIIDASVGIPDEARPENVAAMVEAAFEYGTY
jgi:hypothetical protein